MALSGEDGGNNRVGEMGFCLTGRENQRDRDEFTQSLCRGGCRGVDVPGYAGDTAHGKCPRVSKISSGSETEFSAF